MLSYIGAAKGVEKYIIIYTMYIMLKCVYLQSGSVVQKLSYC